MPIRLSSAFKNNNRWLAQRDTTFICSFSHCDYVYCVCGCKLFLNYRLFWLIHNNPLLPAVLTGAACPYGILCPFLNTLKSFFHCFATAGDKELRNYMDECGIKWNCWYSIPVFSTLTCRQIMGFFLWEKATAMWKTSCWRSYELSRCHWILMNWLVNRLLCRLTTCWHHAHPLNAWKMFVNMVKVWQSVCMRIWIVIKFK
jgi:hypothetical protein